MGYKEGSYSNTTLGEMNMRLNSKTLSRVMNESRTKAITLCALFHSFGAERVMKVWLRSGLRNDSFLIETLTRYYGSHPDAKMHSIQAFMIAAHKLAKERKGVDPDTLLAWALRGTSWSQTTQEKVLHRAYGNSSTTYNTWLDHVTGKPLSAKNINAEAEWLRKL